MAEENNSFQLVTFQLGEELYGVNIMDVKEIVKIQSVRPIPNAPYYVEGIINLRGEIIPIINLLTLVRAGIPSDTGNTRKLQRLYALNFHSSRQS